MAYDFKRLGDVDLVDAPAENANVLIEENGIIKKASKDAVGGSTGGGGSYDAIFDFENLGYGESGVFTVGDYQTLFNKIQASQEVKVLVRAQLAFNDSGYQGIRNVLFYPVCCQLNNEFNICFYITGSNIADKVEVRKIYIESEDSSVYVAGRTPT